MSNYDLLDFVKQFKIKYFRGVFSRDNLPKRIKKECCINNLDNHIGPGTQWICVRNMDDKCEYFDSFGLKMPTDVQKHMLTSGKPIVQSVDIGFCIISWRGKEEDPFCKQYTILNLTCQTKVLITDSS